MLRQLHHPPRDDLVAEAIRQMARELRDYDAERVAGIDKALDRTVAWLSNHLGRCPTAYEVADAAGVSAEEVVEALETASAVAGPRHRQALALRCEGYDRDEIAARMGTCRCGVSRLLRGALRSGRHTAGEGFEHQAT